MLRLITYPLPVTAPNMYLHFNRGIGSNLSETIPLKEQLVSGSSIRPTMGDIFVLEEGRFQSFQLPKGGWVL